MTKNNPKRKYWFNRFIGSAVAYSITVPVSIKVVQTYDLGGLDWLVVLTPMIPTIYGVVCMMKLTDTLDEMQRDIHLKGLAFAAIVTALGSFAYGFLEGLGWPQLELIWILPIMLGLWPIGRMIARRKYQ